MGVGSLFRGLADLVLPGVCPCCGEVDGSGLCPSCRGRARAEEEACPRCGEPVSVELSCPRCAGQGFPHLASVRCGWTYGGSIRELVLRAKDGAGADAARCLAGLMPTPVDGVDLVVPVPPARRPRAGPHLATVLARGTAVRLGVPYRQLLVQTRSAPQQRRLSLPDRRRNVRDLFACKGVPAGSRVLLVDDILTSGSTASQAAGALRRAGARRVDGLFLCRTGC